MKRIISLLCITILLCGIFTALADESSEVTSSGMDYKKAHKEQKKTKIDFDLVELKDSTKEYLTEIDGNVTLCLISNEEDFAKGKYLEYYKDFKSEDTAVYKKVIDTIKTMSEYNKYINVEFIDPFSTTYNPFFEEYGEYNLAYGDLFILCYSNTDGNAKVRKSVITADKFFSYEKNNKKDKLKQIKDSIVEEKIVKKLGSMRTVRNMNIAVLEEFSKEDDYKAVKEYLKSYKYSFSYVSVKDEDLNGYDGIFLINPTSDFKMNDIVILNNYLNNDNKYGKSLIYLPPAKYKNLRNITSFLYKWGVVPDYENRLKSYEEGTYFSKRVQLYGVSEKSDITSNADKDSEYYIMNRATPIKVVKNLSKGYKVNVLLSTKGDRVTVCSAKEKEKYDYIPETEEVASAFDNGRKYPLVTLSEKEEDGKKSYVAVFASSDFITSYFALQNGSEDVVNHTESAKYVPVCGNFLFVRDVMEYVNKANRNKKSGLIDYALTLDEKGIDVTSGIKRDVIMLTAVVSVCVMAAVVLILLIIIESNSNSKRHK